MSWTNTTPNTATWTSESAAFLCAESAVRITTSTGAFIVLAVDPGDVPNPWTNTP